MKFVSITGRCCCDLQMQSFNDTPRVYFLFIIIVRGGLDESSIYMFASSAAFSMMVVCAMYDESISHS